jgi:hypothetical protein
MNPSTTEAYKKRAQEARWSEHERLELIRSINHSLPSDVDFLAMAEQKRLRIVWSEGRSWEILRGQVRIDPLGILLDYACEL